MPNLVRVTKQVWVKRISEVVNKQTTWHHFCTEIFILFMQFHTVPNSWWVLIKLFNEFFYSSITLNLSECSGAIRKKLWHAVFVIRSISSMQVTEGRVWSEWGTISLVITSALCMSNNRLFKWNLSFSVSCSTKISLSSSVWILWGHMTWHSSPQNKQCSRKLKIPSMLLLKSLELLPDESGLSLLLSFILFKKLCMWSGEQFVLMQFLRHQKVVASSASLSARLIACLTKSRYLGRICQYRSSGSSQEILCLTIWHG